MMPGIESTQEDIQHWRLNANPKIWNFTDTPVGSTQTYTSHNERGNKRQKYRYFEQVKPGDTVIGYVTSPDKAIVAICEITKGRYDTPEGESIEFKKVEQFANSVDYEALKEHPDLKDCEPLINNQGSLFRLTEDEYEIIRSIIDDANPLQTGTTVPYTKQDALQSLFMPAQQFDDMLGSVQYKKNLILQGPPGVGKTFVAKRLAYALMGEKDDDRVVMVQFHQSFAYEDFIQGYRPASGGHFALKNGVFFQFCRKAQHDPEARPHVFIIDEINRGNLSKIFGELMMLIEPDKRGKDFAIPLTYAQSPDETFYIPENLYLIGVMNTADRSLAMVDYALRRRFRFITLHPEFQSDRFRKHLADQGAAAGLIDKIIARMTELNDDVASDCKDLGPGYRIGHSYFCPTDGVTPNEAWYRSVVESEIIPLLEEYWFDEEERIENHHRKLLD